VAHTQYADVGEVAGKARFYGRTQIPQRDYQRDSNTNMHVTSVGVCMSLQVASADDGTIVC
jgi:hypothetical protein